MESKNKVWSIALTILITAIVVGGGVYLWQENEALQEDLEEGETVETDDNSYEDSSSDDTSSEDTSSDDTSSDEALTYSIDGAEISLSKETDSFDYSAEQLAARGEECGTTKTSSYYSELISKFSGTNKTIYNFKYTGPSQEPDTFVVTLLPNKADYSSLSEFKKDFDMCSAGGNAYPTMLNENWLLFVNACGTGFSDKSGNPIGCEEAKKVVEPTLQFK